MGRSARSRGRQAGMSVGFLAAGRQYGNNLTGVTAISARDAWAVGLVQRPSPEAAENRRRADAAPALERIFLEDGGIPNGPFGGDQLSGVSASAARNAWAVGDSSGPYSLPLQGLMVRCWYRQPQKQHRTIARRAPAVAYDSMPQQVGVVGSPIDWKAVAGQDDVVAAGFECRDGKPFRESR